MILTQILPYYKIEEVVVDGRRYEAITTVCSWLILDQIMIKVKLKLSQ